MSALAYSFWTAISCFCFKSYCFFFFDACCLLSESLSAFQIVGTICIAILSKDSLIWGENLWTDPLFMLLFKSCLKSPLICAWPIADAWISRTLPKDWARWVNDAKGLSAWSFVASFHLLSCPYWISHQHLINIPRMPFLDYSTPQQCIVALLQT